MKVSYNTKARCYVQICRVVRAAEGAALEMLCTFQVPRVQIPHSTPYKGDTTGYLLFYYTKSAFSEGFEGDRAN